MCDQIVKYSTPLRSSFVDGLRLAVLTRGVRQVETLAALLSGCTLLSGKDLRQAQAVLAWGRKPSARVAEAYAREHDLSVLRIEDGFLRSVDLGSRSPPFSLVIDDLGIYYDATAASRLEGLVAAGHQPDELVRAARLIDCWQAGRLSKYNHAREVPPPVSGPYVLAVDQTFGDASLRFGLADQRSFTRMLDAALDEHPQLPVVLKVHPDVISGRKKGHFDTLSRGQASRIVLVASDAHPPSLLEPAQAIYCVTSQMGFEGLLWGKPVRTFGMPFYAGWGLTSDELGAPERRRTQHRVTLGDLVHAALVEYTRYIDPETRQPCEPERLMEWMALQRRMRERFPPVVHALGFSRWKKPIVRAFCGGSNVRFVRQAEDAPADATLLVWGRRELASTSAQGGARPLGESRGGQQPQAAPDRYRVVRLEDGFLRSVGLGADLVRPLSWVMDGTGIYYDATVASDLENLLRTQDFDARLLARARALRERITAAGITKYNVGAGVWVRPALRQPRAGQEAQKISGKSGSISSVARRTGLPGPSSGDRRVILVPGQVESDASIAWGAPGLRTNMELLQAVRASAPEAYVVYKPHPDVVAGLRKQGQGEGRALQHCDEVVTQVSMGSLLDAVDEVHVLTSLAGFEGLLRGRKVVTYGCPFYAGWGLTEDRERMPRRGRLLSLDELVAGALLLYPVYVSRSTGHFTTAERALEELLAWRAQGPSGLPVWRQALRWVLGMVKAR